VNTSGYGGRKVSKNIVVHTNQADNPRLNLTVTGMVEKFATITPRYLKLTGTAGQKIEATVTIEPTAKYPFKILGAKAQNGQYINYRLDELTSMQGKGYVLTVANQKSTKGGYSDVIYLKTDSPVQPEIKISLYGNIQDPQ
jgi:hypothetical protein